MLKTIKFVYIFISAFFVVTCVKEIPINAPHATHKV